MNPKYKRYKSLTDLYLLLNRDIILHPEEYVEKVPGAAAYIRPLLLESSSSEFNLNISNMCYSKNKFNRLKNTYISQDELKRFKEKVKVQTGMSVTFYFNQEKKKQGTTSDNGPCLISIVLTRPDKRSKWDTATLMYRTTQLNRIFAVDMLLVSKFIQELPDNCEIQTVRLFIPQPWQNVTIMPAYLKLFNVREDEIDSDHPYHEKLRMAFKRNFMDPKKLSSYKLVKREQMKYFGLKTWPDLDQDNYHVQE